MTDENKIGHNSGDNISTAGKRILSFIERVERLEAEKQAIADDIKEVFAESKGAGFDVKTIKKIIKRRKVEAQKLAEEDDLLELYMNAIQGVLL